MNYPYAARAVILAFGSFFFLYAAFGLAVAAVPKRWICERLSPRSAASLLVALRFLPVLCALSLIAGVVIPAFLQGELATGAETVGWFMTLAAAAGVSLWIQSLVRSARALYAVRRLQGPERQYVLETGDPFLAVTGIRRPHIVVSRGFLEAIPAEQQEVAMRHEMAHFRAADNLKRLLMLLAPPLAFAALEQSWARYAERAADDRAVQGDPERAALLAEVLLRVARSRAKTSPVLASALVGSASEIHARVERLLAPQRQADHSFSLLLLAPLLLTACLAAQGATESLFTLLERLLHT
ncbi:MAG: M56 family metallopeptidase [Bryobacteraceae bacterium]